MGTKRRSGYVSFRRPGIEPQMGRMLSRLAQSVPSVTQGTTFPGGAVFGDMHFYTGITDDDYTKNNWYAFTPNGTWDSMNATNTEGKNITGDIPSGVTVADYLSLFGGTMEGAIVFADDQTLPAEKLVGDIPTGVRIRDYLPLAGGQLTGNLIMSRTNITRLNYLTGYDDSIKVDLGTDGEMTLSADTLVKIQAAAIQLIGALALTGNLDMTGDLTVTGDTDLTGAFDLTGDAVISGDLQVNGGDIGISTDTDLIQLAADIVTLNGDVKIPSDSKAIFFGAGNDAKIYYDGTDLRIVSDLVAASDLVVDCGTNKTLELAEVVYKDMNMSVGVFTQPAASIPDEAEFVDSAGMGTSIYSYGFAVNEKVSGSMELQHDYKEGTNLSFHIHWQGVAAPTGTDKVKWRLNYSVARDDVVIPATTEIFIETNFDTRYEMVQSTFADIVGTNFKIGDQFLFLLSRVAASADEYAGDAIVATIGIHYQVDTLGSRQMLVK